VYPPDDAAFMRRALELAYLGRGVTHPNPLVGAVVAGKGTVVGEGFHAQYGGPHGEVMALAAAGEAARGATLYVTLEPCAHHGLTPPCTDAVVRAGIVRVVYAAEDPNPDARGGAEVLRSAGVEVTAGVERSAARSLNAPFFFIHERPGVYVALKLAVSIDGAVAAAPGTRTRITGPEAVAEAHRLRACYDAVMIGSGTARIDDPLLTVRVAAAHRQPVRVVLDSAATLPPASQLARSAADAPLLVVCGSDVPADRTARLEDAGVAICRVPRNADGLDLHAVLDSLEGRGLRTVIAEGGPTLATALLRAGMVRRIHLFVAPSVLGPDAPRACTAPVDAGAWQCVRAERCGADALLTFDPVQGA
jgi:diaminohydroxyphosphoribosylaminopyrimidine deaminase/5-amino-6-(5-phosphoribosylamino)uracil reductase